MDIFLKAIRLVNFKIFKDETILCNKELNIFVGDNATGKSTILQALDIVLSGSITKVMTIGLENLINVDVASDWMKTQTLGSLPMMRVELFFEMPNLPKFEKYFGEKYLGAQNVSKYGIKMACAPNANRNENIAKTIHDRKCTTFPFELYEVQFSTFGRDQYSGYERPCHFLYVDNTAINTARALRYVIESTYQNAVEEVDRASTQYQFRQHVSCFKLPQSALGKNLTVIGDLTSCLDIKDKGVSLANCGEGKISICKTKSALDKRVTDVSILALEEPENHLSHYNLRHLISMVRNRAEDNQLFIVTHSSYITSRLGLQNAFFVRNGNVSSLSKLSPDTSDFFMKAPNDNLLQFVLSRKVILVEGAAEYILMDKFIREVTGMETSPTDIWIMALNNLSFRRYLEVGKLLDMKIAAVRDNDGNPQKWYEDLQSDNRKVFSDPIKERKTFEVCLYQDNKDVLDSIFPDREFVLDYMLKHKAEAAYQILVANQKLVVPQYIKEAIEWIWRP